MLAVSRSAFAGMIAQAYDCYPEEACGLLIGRPNGSNVVRFVPCENTTRSGKVYTIEPRVMLRAEREAESDGMEIIGVMHSHTHTEPYPSQTDVNQAPDPSWHYIIVSLKRDAPEVRSYLLVDGTIAEETIAVGVMVSVGKGDSMATVINDAEHIEVDAELGARWLMQPEAFTALTGWTLKPEGLCRDELCAPIYHPDKVLSYGLIDLQEAAPIIGLSAVTDPERGVAALTISAPERAQQMVSLRAPDFTLQNLSGEPVSLHDFNRRKVLLLAWSSW